MNIFFRFILITALFTQAMIPVGYMPSFANDIITLEICSGLTNKTENIDIDNHDNRSNDNTAIECPYFSMSGGIHIQHPKLNLLDNNFIIADFSSYNFSFSKIVIPSNYKTGPPVTL